MYPWHKSLASWADGTGLHIDALGLVTILGAEEMDRTIGRLVPSAYLDYLPLLGAFIVAGNRFTKKQPGFTIYNMSAGIVTTEVAGWFSRWLKSQHLHQARSKITWNVEKRPPRWTATLVGFLLIGLPCNGMLIALTVLAEDWWGFANAMAMVASVVVRCFLVAQNQAGIDANIRAAEEEAKEDNHGAEEEAKEDNHDEKSEPPTSIAKVIVVTNDSKAVAIEAPPHLIKWLFTPNHSVPNPHVYTLFRWIGWLAFAIHIISIGMAALYTQICTVVLLVVATVLTANKFGCADSRAWKISRIWRHVDENEGYTCWVSPNLKATISTYPAAYSVWAETKPGIKIPVPDDVKEKPVVGQERPVGGPKFPWWGRRIKMDVESNPPRNETREIASKPIRERRQDLYVWLDLEEEEDDHMVAWGLIPRNLEWIAAYRDKKEFHSKRIGQEKGKELED